MVLCHGLGLHHCALVALALEDPLFALILLHLWYGLLTVLAVRLVATVAFRRARPLDFGTAAFRGVVALLHDISLRNVVRLLLLVKHLVVLLEVLRKGLLVLVRPLTVHKEAVIG